MRRRTFPLFSNFLEKEQTFPGDIALYGYGPNGDEVNKRVFYIKSSDLKQFNIDNDRLSIAGIVIAPSIHNIYGDDEPALMSIHCMDNNNYNPIGNNSSVASSPPVFYNSEHPYQYSNGSTKESAQYPTVDSILGFTTRTLQKNSTVELATSYPNPALLEIINLSLGIAGKVCAYIPELRTAEEWNNVTTLSTSYSLLNQGSCMTITYPENYYISNNYGSYAQLASLTDFYEFSNGTYQPYYNTTSTTGNFIFTPYLMSNHSQNPAYSLYDMPPFFDNMVATVMKYDFSDNGLSDFYGSIYQNALNTINAKYIFGSKEGSINYTYYPLVDIVSKYKAFPGDNSKWHVPTLGELCYWWTFKNTKIANAISAIQTYSPNSRCNVNNVTQPHCATCHTVNNLYYTIYNGAIRLRDGSATAHTMAFISAGNITESEIINKA